jgi:transcription initiation factor TFIID TATA-box-binding protein
MVNLVIENIVATANLHQKLNLEEISCMLPAASFDPSENPTMVYRFDELHGAVLLAANGKISCTGTKTLIDAEECINFVVNELQNHDVSVEQPVTKIDSVVATASSDQTVSLELIAKEFPQQKIILPSEETAWLTYHYDEHLSILFFTSGKMVFTGRKNPAQLSNILETLKDTLSSTGVI